MTEPETATALIERLGKVEAYITGGAEYGSEKVVWTIGHDDARRLLELARIGALVEGGAPELLSRMCIAYLRTTGARDPILHRDMRAVLASIKESANEA